VRLHPREPTLAVLAAAEALAHEDPRAVRWINRGMQLAPGWTAPHLQAFQWLWRIGQRSQALLELRAAAEINSEAAREYVCLAARAGNELALGVATPRKHGDQRAEFLEMAVGCLPLMSQAARGFDAILRKEFPERPEAHERNAIRLAHDGQLQTALSELDALQHKHEARAQTKALRVRLLYESSRYAEAAREAMALASTLDGPDAAQLWTWRARALAELGDDAGWTGAVAALRRAVSDDIDRLADTYALEGELYLKRRQTGSALRAYASAYRIKADSGYLATLAGLSLELGDRAGALRALMQLCELEPDKNYCSRRDSLIEEGKASNFGLKLRN
jgi:tetratricopeptide (TPR) repeat protein